MLGFIGVKVGENWEEWRDKLHYFDYVVVAGLVGLAVYAFVKWRRGGGSGPSSERDEATAGDAATVTEG